MKATDFLDVLAPAIEVGAKMAIEAFLKYAMEKEPTHTKVLIASLYPVIDCELEPVVEKTPSELDNAIVSAIKDAMEQTAEAAGFTLENLDED
jgi:hypothetical protein